MASDRRLRSRPCEPTQRSHVFQEGFREDLQSWCGSQELGKDPPDSKAGGTLCDGGGPVFKSGEGHEKTRHCRDQAGGCRVGA